MSLKIVEKSINTKKDLTVKKKNKRSKKAKYFILILNSFKIFENLNGLIIEKKIAF